jgi:hypothetical protein
MNLQFAAVLFELPGVKATARRQAQIDTVVLDQLLRLKLSRRSWVHSARFTQENPM